MEKEENWLKTRTSENFYIPNISRQFQIQDSYNPNLQQNLKPIKQDKYLQQQKEFGQIRKQIHEIQSKIKLFKSKLQEQTLNEQQLQEWQRQKSKIFEKIKMQNKQQIEQIKAKIMNKIGLLDQQMKQILRIKRQQKKKIDKNLKADIQELREYTKITIKKLEKEKTDKFEKLINKNKSLQKKMKEMRKINEERKTNAFGTIQKIRVKFHQKIKEEQKKREQNNRILSELLEKTCLKAEKKRNLLF